MQTITNIRRFRAAVDSLSRIVAGLPRACSSITVRQTASGAEIATDGAGPFILPGMDALALLIPASVPTGGTVMTDAQDVIRMTEELERTREQLRRVKADRDVYCKRAMAAEGAPAVSDLQGRLATALERADRMEGERAEWDRERDALVRTVERLRAGAAPAQEQKPSRVRITFPAGQQGRMLRAEGLTVDDLKAAGFRWRFVDPREPSEGGWWEAEASDATRALAARFPAAPV